MENGNRLAEFSEMEDSKFWEYSMRREMQLIVPGLYLGPYICASKMKLSALIEHGITHIVCVRDSNERKFIGPKLPEQFTYLEVEVCDSSCANILQHFRGVNGFVLDALSRGGAVLVHDNIGDSRSAALVCAFLMEKYSSTFSEAYNHVRSRRFLANVNDGFRNQLKEFEPILRANQTTACVASANKRKHDN